MSWNGQTVWPDERYDDPIPHGTLAGYKYHECRCDDCKRANREQVRRQRAEIRRREGAMHRPPRKGRPSEEWKDDAACRFPDVPTSLFFADDRNPKATIRAKQICALCPVRDACLEWAMSFSTHDDQHGVCGGLTERERRLLRRRRSAS